MSTFFFLVILAGGALCHVATFLVGVGIGSWRSNAIKLHGGFRNGNSGESESERAIREERERWHSLASGSLARCSGACKTGCEKKRIDPAA